MEIRWLKRQKEEISCWIDRRQKLNNFFFFEFFNFPMYVPLSSLMLQHNNLTVDTAPQVFNILKEIYIDELLTTCTSQR